MRVIITNTPGKPIYEQIKEQIKKAILDDELAEGEMLPSIRQLARDLKISVITTTRAYTDLEEEGFVVNVQGKGCFVSPKNSDLLREKLLLKVEEGFLTAVNAGKTARLSREDLIKMLELLLEDNENE